MDKEQIQLARQNRPGSDWEKVLDVINQTPCGVTTSGHLGLPLDEKEVDITLLPDTPPDRLPDDTPTTPLHTPGA